jgi:hypothetical protein
VPVFLNSGSALPKTLEHLKVSAFHHAFSASAPINVPAISAAGPLSAF